MKKPVRTLVVLDPFGTPDQSPEQEFAEVVQLYEQRHGLTLDARTDDVFLPDDATDVDLVIFDWGGMSLGNSVMEHQIRQMLQWCEDHSSALVIMRSRLGAAALEDELDQEQGAGQPNILIDTGGGNVRRPHADLNDGELPGWWKNGRSNGCARG